MKNTYLKIFLIFLCFLLHSSYSGAEPWYYRYCREVYEGCASTCRTDSDVCTLTRLLVKNVGVIN